MARRLLLTWAAVVAPLVALPGAELHGQDGFLFRAPSAQLTLRAGPLVPRAQGDLFDEMTGELTLERRDFHAPMLGAELALLLGPRFDLAVGLSRAESRATSEYREFIGDDGLPIVQTTRLRTMPLTVTARVHAVPRGRAASQLAWLPARVTPYAGAGAGMTWYRLSQEGEFVLRSTGDIFLQQYESSDNGMTVHGLAGLDYWVTPRAGLNLEGRYTRGSAPVGGSYQRFDSMDLSGLQAAIGVSIRW
jgi:hypothetical protein